MLKSDGDDSFVFLIEVSRGRLNSMINIIPYH